MSWAAANLPRRRRSSLGAGVGIGGSGLGGEEGNNTATNNANDSVRNIDENDTSGRFLGANISGIDNRSLVGVEEGGRTRTRTKRGETVEAVLSRLSKAYSVSMECLGSLHQLEESYNRTKSTSPKGSDETENDNEKEKEKIKKKQQQLQQSMSKVALACRQTLETAILMDPLIVAPTLRHTMQQFAYRDRNTIADSASSAASASASASASSSPSRWIDLCNRKRPEPPQINSKSHKSTIRQISYLALTNYADLLMSCSSSNSSTTNPSSSSTNGNPKQQQQQQQLLDRGVVKKLKGFDDNNDEDDDKTTRSNIWGSGDNNESEEDIQRLALVALCDASALDGSDPVLWLKLACAARSMGRIKFYQQQTTTTPTPTPTMETTTPLQSFYPILSPYRRLERHALESGYQCLPSNVPPNRAITKSLQELNNDQYPEDYNYCSNDASLSSSSSAAASPPPLEQSKLCLDMTRYSWSLLGRLLMKAYRGEGTDETTTTTSKTTKQLLAFGVGDSGGKIGHGSSSYPSVISLSISPMLLLPSSVLARILSFMETQSIWNFEATCRALSVSIMSVRATLEKQQQHQQHQQPKQTDGMSVHHQQVEQEQQQQQQNEEENMVTSSPPPPSLAAAGTEAPAQPPPPAPETEAMDDPMDIDDAKDEKDEKEGEKEEQQHIQEGSTDENNPRVTSVTTTTSGPTPTSNATSDGMDEQQQKEGETEETGDGSATGTKTTTTLTVINTTSEDTATKTTTTSPAGDSKTTSTLDDAVSAKEEGAKQKEESKGEIYKIDNDDSMDVEMAEEGTTTTTSTAAEKLPLSSAKEREEDSPRSDLDVSEEQKEGLKIVSATHRDDEASTGQQRKEEENDATEPSTDREPKREKVRQEQVIDEMTDKPTAEQETKEEQVQEEAAEGEPQQGGNDTEKSKGGNDTTEQNRSEISNEGSIGGDKTTTEQQEESTEKGGANPSEPPMDEENTSTQPKGEEDAITVAPTPASPSASDAAPAPAPAPTPAPKRGRRPRSASLEPFRVSSRSSKRVRSQQMTSDKKDEKLRKRKSVDFCLRAAIFGAAADKDVDSSSSSSNNDNMSNGISVSVEWDTVRASSWQLPAVLENKNTGGAAGFRGKASSTEGARQRFEAEERISPSSLSSFLRRMSSEKAGPGVLLEQYLGHVALHVEEVFSVDPGDAVVLTSSLLESLELLMEQKSYHKLLPQFYDYEDLSSSHSIHRSLKLFAIDLLNVELRFKTCERQQSFSITYDDDINFVCCMIPVLLGGMAHLEEELEKTNSKRREWIKLKTRVNWLAAGIYLWRSRLTLSVCESIEAEELGMKFIDSTIDCVRDTNISVATPHLDSPLRSGPHWRNLCKETLFAYRDEIQASSVVSHAQQQFQDRVAKIVNRSKEAEAEAEKTQLIDEDISAFSGIGQTLLTRYEAPFGSDESKHGELLDDFISIHGDECLPGPGDAAPSAEKMDAALPVAAFNVDLCREMTNTSILTILVACLQVKSSSHKTMVVLLLRLLLTALNRHEHICLSASQDQSPDSFSDSEDADSIENDAASDVDMGENGNAPRNDAIKCGRLINYLLERTLKSISHLMNEEDKEEIVTSEEFLQLVHHSLGFTSSWVSHFSQQPHALEELLDKKVFMSICALVNFCFDGSQTSRFTSLKELHFGGLVRIISSQQMSFASLVRVQGTIRARRAVRLRICILRAEFIATALNEISKVLSENLFSVKGGLMTRSEVLKAPIFETTANSATSSPQPFQIQILCDALLWFSQYQKEAEGNAANSFDRPILERLRVPLIAAIVSFCGSCSESRSDYSKDSDARSSKDPLSLRDFLDSDASAHGCSDQEEEKKDGNRKELLRVLCHIVHCIGLVFGKVDEKEVVSFDGAGLYSTEHGPLLPLVATRVLNHVADILLCEFAEDENESYAQGLWALKYPFGTGAIGYLVDSALYKAYKCLHGFTLASSNDFYSGKENLTVSSSDLDIKKRYAPESHQAAAQLYRCIVRAGKKTPPKAALETVSSALPPLKESQKSRRISDFLFSNDAEGFGVDDIMSIATESQGWTKCFEMVKRWDDVEAPGEHLIDGALGKQVDLGVADGDLQGNHSMDTIDDEGIQGTEGETTGDHQKKATDKERATASDNQAKSKVTNSDSPDKEDGEHMAGAKQIDNKASDDEVMFLRKGVFSMLAQGDLPVFSNDVGGKEDDRAGAKRFEEELSKKFLAIFNTLKYGDTNDLRGWFRAAQCLMFKADVVAERLGMSNGFSRSKNFHIPEQRVPAVSRLSLAALDEKQEKESAVRALGWIGYLGDDLSLYIEHQWSSFESLKKLSDEVLATDKSCDSTGEEEVDAFIARVKKEVHGMQQKGRLMDWQQAWGGMFVTALKKMAIRCLSLAVYLFHENVSVMKTEDKDLMPEIMETMGLILYSGLLGSQTYGYPMHSTTTKQKRLSADASRSCFQRAVDLARSAEDGQDADTWDLVFMIGKCHEKIAGTYKLEMYQNPSGDSKSIRLFEKHMREALDCYRASLDEKPDVDIEAGGSSHGPTEIFYRLHASRLKCLLESAMAVESERGAAEEEALRLTEKHWFSPPTDPLEDSPVRDRIWNVLADIVSALAKCRLEHAFFHRSVYRHAQALMWAPVLCDPVACRVEGSKSTVPATRSFQIRSLNHATSAAKSALAVMTSLFEKKRSQLCAVWVTTTYPPTAFETLNNSARKYDSLRGKYISAFIDCHRLCGNRSELETLLRWLSSSKRDLPSLYQSSAKTEGRKPDKSHNNDSLLVKASSLSSFNLLTGLKRQANSAMAHVLTDELSSEESNVRSVENHLKLAYACFLRMNCSVKDLKKTRAWKYGPQGVWEAEAVCKAFLKLDEREKLQTDPNDWSGRGQKAAILDAALQKCKQVFPSVTAHYYSKKTNQKVKSQEEAESKDSNNKPSSQLSGSKRSFEVKVPEGLAEGETFTTTIKSGDNAKKVKLTVPSGKPRMLRFSLDLSTQTD